MLFLKRLLTAGVFFVVLFVICLISGLMVLGGIAGAKAAPGSGAKDFQSGYAVGQKAGAEIGRKYGRVLTVGAAGTAAAASLAISFSGLLPWCRRKD
ncbi:hypothetical protein BH09VER1_BH09VER1_30710 [soil metagenome]